MYRAHMSTSTKRKSRNLRVIMPDSEYRRIKSAAALQGETISMYALAMIRAGREHAKMMMKAK